MNRRAPELRFPQSRGILDLPWISIVGGTAYRQSTGTSGLSLRAVVRPLQSVPGPLFRSGQGTAILARREGVGNLCFDRRGTNSAGVMKVYADCVYGCSSALIHYKDGARSCRMGLSRNLRANDLLPGNNYHISPYVHLEVARGVKQLLPIIQRL